MKEENKELMKLIEEYAEARNSYGSRFYNVKTAKAYEKVVKYLESRTLVQIF